uniref:U2A'/phosphoprotein 32 family A C-terminal domain-containing protein n=2 Tax=Esox lucius TaxID=8010 RepID=A0A3P8YF87_ESOLU
MLRYLWLNNNKIKNLSHNTLNCCVTELYLQNNEIKSISGALGHLTCLKVLLLHNNQMQKLEDCMAELRNMHNLHTVKPEYRQYVVHQLPSVQVLDRREVKQEERSRSFQLFRPERHRVLQSLAFGRRAETPLGRQTSIYGEGRRLLRFPLDDTADPSERTAKRSIMQFSTVDWKSIPTSNQRPLGERDQRGPNILIVTLR